MFFPLTLLLSRSGCWCPWIIYRVAYYRRRVTLKGGDANRVAAPAGRTGAHPDVVLASAVELFTYTAGVTAEVI